MFGLLPHLLNGLMLGLLFALIALGFMLIVGVMETINLAHGSLFALGMYAALFVMAPRVPWWEALPIGTRFAVALFAAPLLVGLFGLLLELCLRRTYGRDPLYGLLLTFGAALVIEEGIRLVWGSTEKQLPLPEVLSGAFLTFAIVIGEFTMAALLDRPAFGPYLQLVGANRAYEPAALAIITFVVTWACMGLIQVLGRRAPGKTAGAH